MAIYSIREHFDEWVSIQYLLTNEMSELKLSFPYPALSFHFITYTYLLGLHINLEKLKNVTIFLISFSLRIVK